MNWENLNVLVTGGAGFLGSRVVEELRRRAAKNITIPRSVDSNLRVRENCSRLVVGKNVVIHLAGKVGGIGFTWSKPGEVFFDNVLIGIQLVEEARLAGVEKFVSIGSVCCYPKFTPTPFNEKDLWDGYPEETNASYGMAKKMLLVQGQAYRQQYGFNSIFLMPTNIYGPGDNFDLDSSHVIPALIRKMVDAKAAGKDNVVLWGDGSPTREFIYAEDAARGIILATELYDKPDPVNLGSGVEISIRDLAYLIAKLTGFKGEITWDKTKPNGQPRRVLDVSKAEQEFEFRAKITLEEGLRRTIDWYKRIRTDN